MKIATEVVGIREGFKHFATMHIMISKKGTYFLADTSINHESDTETLVDIERLAKRSVEYFAKDPVMAMVSFSNFGSNTESSPKMVHDAVDFLHENYPDMVVDG